MKKILLVFIPILSIYSMQAELSQEQAPLGLEESLHNYCQGRKARYEEYTHTRTAFPGFVEGHLSRQQAEEQEKRLTDSMEEGCQYLAVKINSKEFLAALKIADVSYGQSPYMKELYAELGFNNNREDNYRDSLLMYQRLELLDTVFHVQKELKEEDLERDFVLHRR